MWSWDLAFKIKLFTWLATKNKILTWENLQKKGWERLSFCSLCSKDSEIVLHLFVNFSFTLQLWYILQTTYSLSSPWGGNSLTNCFDSWSKKEKVFNTLPSLAC
jgi:hypothetical protein